MCLWSEQWAVGTMGRRTNGLSEQWVVGTMGRRNNSKIVGLGNFDLFFL